MVGPHGETTPGNEEIYADAYHRVRVQYFWQKGQTADDRNSAWVPVMQRTAGPTRGASFLPRIGQEVLVGFMNAQLDQPVVLVSVYNGRGEGSGFSREDRARQSSEDRAQQSSEDRDTQTSEAAAPDPTASPDIFAQAHDSQPAGQGNRAAGQSPAWHGAAGTAHNHAAALLGLRTQEWAGLGHNQLLFDDTDQQLGMQLATTQYTTQFNFGHLRHRADNYRGSLRGQGFEIRTDAYGVVRARQGLHLTTWGKDLATPMGDAAATQRLMQIARDMGKNLSSAATTHQTVALSSVAGVSAQQPSAIRSDLPPLAAMAHAVSGMVDGANTQQAQTDASQHVTTPGAGKVPHSTDALLTVAGRGGIGLTATEVQMATGQTHTSLAGQHHYTGVAGQTRIHSGQAIGLLGGVIQANDGLGLQLIAGNHDIKVQAQSDTMQIASQKDMTLTANQNIDLAAAKEITLKTAGGASITIGQGITVQCPGAFTIHASAHRFMNGGGVSYGLPVMPRGEMPLREMEFNLALSDVPGDSGRPLADTHWMIVKSMERPQGMAFVDENDITLQGRSDDQGKIKLTQAENKILAEAYCASPSKMWLIYPGHAALLNVQEEQQNWSQQDKLMHALSAADFSDSLRRTRYEAGVPDEITHAKKMLDAQSQADIIAKALKK